MESRGPEDSKNVKTSQAYFFEGFISFFEDFSLSIGRSVTGELANKGQMVTFPKERDHYDQASKVISNGELFFIT